MTAISTSGAARVQCDSARRTPRSTSPPDSARSDLHPASLLLRDILDRIRTESQDESEKGRWREQLFMRIALQQPEFELNGIWRWPDWPEREVLTGLNGRDIGIDFVARWTTGERVAVQCKCYEDRCTLGKDEIDKFLGGSQQLVFRLRWIVKVI